MTAGRISGLWIAALALAGCVSTPASGEHRESWGTLPLTEASCVPDDDGVLRRAELSVLNGTPASGLYLLDSSDEGIDLDGPATEQGEWNWLLDYAPGAATTQVERGATPPKTSWYRDDFPDAELELALDGSVGMRALYRIEGDGEEAQLQLLGIASEIQGYTSLRYSPAVDVFRIPLSPGDSWEQTVVGSGLLDGETWPRTDSSAGEMTLSHRFRFSTGNWGKVRTPAANFNALRLDTETRSEATSSWLGLVAADEFRSTQLLAECSGIIAQLRSLPSEADPEFTTATSVLRLGLHGDLL